MVDLRAYVFLDSLQPQFASYQATVAKGFLPTQGQASLMVEQMKGSLFEAMRLDLLFHQEAPGYLDLLRQGVSRCRARIDA